MCNWGNWATRTREFHNLYVVVYTRNYIRSLCMAQWLDSTILANYDDNKAVIQESRQKRQTSLLGL